MPKPIKLGRRERMNFGKINEVAEMPNLIEIQTKSFEWFKKIGLREVFDDVSPIKDYAGNYSLEIGDYKLEVSPKYSQAECKERDATYSVRLTANVTLTRNEPFEIKERPVFMGEFPLMTEKGTFIYNGAERVIVTQLVRSPGAYYGLEKDKSNKELYSAQIIPNRGAWLEYETDSNDILYMRLDRTKKQPITVLLRALGLENKDGKDQIIDTFGEDDRLLKTIEKDNKINTEDEGLKKIYEILRPGEPAAAENARALIGGMLFDARRYDLARVGRYKYNKKLGLANRIQDAILAEDAVDPTTGEVILEKGETVSAEKALEIENSGLVYVMVYGQNKGMEDKVVKVIGNNFVDITKHVDIDLEDTRVEKQAFFPVLKEIMDEAKNKKELKQMLIERRNELSPRHILHEDIIASVSYMMNLSYGIGKTDDIDHLGNRRLRTVGELLQNQFRIGLSRMEKTVRERMTTQDMATTSPQQLINIKPITAAIKEFFGSSQLSQFMDQTNPLAELTHKRRLSALGPGGLTRERAGLEVREVHYSHYGRMCPIETPEGPNIGLIGSITTYGKVNEYGFIEAPYRKVKKVYDKKGNIKDVIVTDEIEYLTADDEEPMIVAQANEPLDSKGHFVNLKVSSRGVGGNIALVPREKIDYMDVSPKQAISVATAMIPFLENDDPHRALMGSNMQRQAVPLLVTEAPIVGTGMEYQAAKDAGIVVSAKNSGKVVKVDAKEIIIKRDKDGEEDVYELLKFKRSNSGTCINQRPIVNEGEKVKKGEVIADGPSTNLGEISLGKNLLIGFMTWEGYNYEDAIILNERLLIDDVLTSIHIEKYEIEARDTKTGKEEITKDIPNIGEEARKDLDENGIIRLGAEVSSTDILVGKVTPKGSVEPAPEDRLLISIFGEKAREVRNTSLCVPNGVSGIVVGTKVLSTANNDELEPGINKVVRVYIATKRKINVGDKMAGRHGNKGVISKILPEEDMPFLDNGKALEVMLNPLGIPSRMNVGQVLEVHLGLAAKRQGWYISTPVFDGAKEADITKLLVDGGFDETGKTMLRDGRTGEFFDNPVTVGYMYMLKLNHLVDDKIHARSTGPYSLVTQQPLGGKAQFGGQRFGEMEVWALEGYGAAHSLQEILTIKSDDTIGRTDAYESIVKNGNIPVPGMTESFKVLIKEMQSLGLDITVLNDKNQEIEINSEEIEKRQEALRGRGNRLLKMAGIEEPTFDEPEETVANESDLEG